jgi:uncharacterized linocin/CFP29 family protein
MNGIWNEMIWNGINDEVRKAAGQIRVGQKIFPTVRLDNPTSISDDQLDLNDPANPHIPEGLAKPMIEISVRFQLSPNQVAHEGALQNGLKLARLRAKDLAQTEDMILFRGINSPQQQGITVTNITAQSVGTGLWGFAGHEIKVDPLPAGQGIIYGENTFNRIVEGINYLVGKLQPGPFALILHYNVYADTYSASRPGFTITADRITPLITGGFFATAALPPNTGLLVSLGGEPTTLYVGAEPAATFLRKDDRESHFFRVFERFQFSARDPRAFVRLKFVPLPGP